MPLTTLHPLLDVLVTTANPTAGSAGGSRVSAPSPIRGVLLEAGFMPWSAVSSTMTLNVALGNNNSATASNFSNAISSANESFTSTNLPEGAIASATPLSIATATVNPGDAIQWTTSGGPTSALGATMYAILRRN